MHARAYGSQRARYYSISAATWPQISR